MLNVTVDRSKWDIRSNRKVIKGKEFNNYFDHACLLNPETKLMCCLGFVGKACGIQNIDLEEKFTPQDSTSDKWPESLLNADEHDTDICESLIRTNDDGKISNQRREERIQRLGLKAGIKFKFVGKYLTKKGT